MARRLPPLRALEVFEALGRTGAVARAAAELSVSPGAVSQQIVKLEDHLGAELVRRSGRGVEMTAIARVYFELVADGFARLRDAQRVFDRTRDVGGLSVSALPSLMVKWLAPRLYAWQQTRPYLDLRLESTHREADLAQGSVDFRLTYGHAAALHRNHRALFTDAVVPVAAPSLIGAAPARSAGAIAPATLARLPLIHIDWRPDHPNGPSWADWFALVGLKGTPASGPTYSLSSVALDAAIAGAGVALGQRSFIAEDVAAGRLVALSVRALALPEAYYVAWSDGALDKPDGRALLDWLTGEARAMEKAAP